MWAIKVGGRVGRNRRKSFLRQISHKCIYYLIVFDAMLNRRVFVVFLVSGEMSARHLLARDTCLCRLWAKRAEEVDRLLVSAWATRGLPNPDYISSRKAVRNFFPSHFHNFSDHFLQFPLSRSHPDRVFLCSSLDFYLSERLLQNNLLSNSLSMLRQTLSTVTDCFTDSP
jgi:hypothetical protein